MAHVAGRLDSLLLEDCNKLDVIKWVVARDVAPGFIMEALR